MRKLFTKLRTVSDYGFSLIELLIVVSILAIIITMGFTSYQATQRNARDSRRRTDLEKVRQALELYRTDNGFYPNAGVGSWIDLTETNLGVLTPDFINEIPTDPKQPSTTTPYRYQATNLSGGSYYGYCLESELEALEDTDPPENSPACIAEIDYDLTIQQP